MGGSYFMTVGNKGRVVLPADLRARFGWEEGVTLIAVETDNGVNVMERSEALKLIRAELAGSHILEELFAERRAESAREDAGES
ncbi:AbrB/MazE/SpoVT family DNA-binding domain-containing protein [Gryllotalpicola protaetiae]|uniref:AbrB/MazE/SpoVT family DNA-binding domain-containing protein n=1 Tax=Gryllotalpicola protaetiae TaxID=2419771 RepID=A0A387BLU7_9MICO|nr:AbrB/MazE/SpoVT family DNA-binding domain-containing protein [Gryllotalpicola protaetiae]AYG03608.1 AbrB/MazE/SpoVT family DNA-binding domain-containing protein [Gryllotalpicola protaetiae]